MELLLITATRLKIVMSNKDMKKYEITCDALDYSDSETKRVLRSILDEAKQKTGFDTEGQQIYVQVFPSKDGGCEMYVTRTSLHTKNTLPVPVHNTVRQRATIFKFKNTTDMLEACRHLQTQHLCCTSQAYCDLDGDACYLVIFGGKEDAFGRDPMYLSVANEYGSLIKGEYGCAYLHEHCRCICGLDAIEVLSALHG